MNSAKRYRFVGEDERLNKKLLYTLVEAASAVGIHQKTMFSRMHNKFEKVITDYDLRPTEGFFGGTHRGSRTYASRFSSPAERFSAKWLKKHIVNDIEFINNLHLK
jgi:hypothetical protein|tara:strand:+ start:124 stop:441 length:318 start_codon:yes stop_codon:yes gene_type:complete